MLSLLTTLELYVFVLQKSTENYENNSQIKRRFLVDYHNSVTFDMELALSPGKLRTGERKGERCAAEKTEATRFGHMSCTDGRKVKTSG